jgi:uncharacterized OsmC-like protein
MSSTPPPPTLREKQAPLKAQYKSDPTSALITLHATGTLDASSTSITCKLDTGAQIAAANARVAGLHPKAGGDGLALSGELCSGDLLLEALVACAGVTLKAVATALGLALRAGTVRAEGDLDFKGTLGVDREAAVGFTAIRVGFEVEFEEGVEVSDEVVERLGRLTERYCVVLQTIVKKPELSVQLVGRERGGEGGVERSVVWGQRG